MPALERYWDYGAFGESQLPDTEEPGSRLMWHSFRLVHRMYRKWEALSEDQDVRLDPEGNVEDRYLPPVKKKTKGAKGSKSGKGEAMP